MPIIFYNCIDILKTINYKSTENYYLSYKCRNKYHDTMEK